MVYAILLLFLLTQTSQKEEKQIKPPQIPTQAKTMMPEKALVFQPVPTAGAKPPSREKPHYKPLSDAERRVIIQHTVNVSPATFTPFLTLTSQHFGEPGKGFLEFSYPQWFTAVPVFFDGNPPSASDCYECRLIFRAEGIDLYLYLQPNQSYFVDLITVIPNGQRVFQVTQQMVTPAGQPPPVPVGGDQTVGVPNVPTFSHVFAQINPPITVSSPYWLKLHYEIEPVDSLSHGDTGPWSFMEVDVSSF